LITKRKRKRREGETVMLNEGRVVEVERLTMLPYSMQLDAN